jgi:hypothetical protein
MKLKFNLNLKRFSKLVPTFLRKPKSKPAVLAVAKSSTNSSLTTTPKPLVPAANQPSTALTPAAPQTPATSPKSLLPKPKAPELLGSVVNFLRQYLSADDHRLNVLALWIAHTWCFQNSPTAVYLDVRSPESHCGKSICMKLLAMLSAESWLATGADPRTIMGRFLTEQRRVKPGKLAELHPPFTLLLDNYHHTLGRSERQALLAMLCSGSSATARYALGTSEYCLFGPKAFAGHGPLPRSLADQCLPIFLYRKKPSEVLARIHPDLAHNAASLARGLQQWADEAATAILQAGKRTPENLPFELGQAERTNAEPLIHIADLIGGEWPQRARKAIIGIYKDFDFSPSLTALDDVRTWFFMKGDPSYLYTSELLEMMRSQENRPWSAWPRNSGRRLGALLRPFGLVSRNLTEPSGKTYKGYVFRDLKEPVERFLPPLPYQSVKDMPTQSPLESRTLVD